MKPLEIDPGSVATIIERAIRREVLETLRKRGVVIGISGGIDSAVCTALATRALGRDKVFGLLMPERDSSSKSTDLGRLVAESFGIEYAIEDIAPALEAIGCYRKQTEAIRRVFPEYGEGWKCKVTLPSILDGDRISISRLTVQSPNGEAVTKRMPHDAYLELVAATNYKQRVRKTTEYYHADRLGYAVVGTPNLLEYDQGFFVKQGDGTADIEPIADLYKTQVYALARHLDVPDEVRRQLPTTDTYSMPQSQEEFYFALPYDKMDICLWGRNEGLTPEELTKWVELTPEQIERVYRDIDAKRRQARYLHMRPIVIGAH